jgi:hypothetical protein
MSIFVVEKWFYICPKSGEKLFSFPPKEMNMLEYNCKNKLFITKGRDAAFMAGS